MLMEMEATNIERPVTITNRGMLTIPAAMRKRLGLVDGDKVVLIEDEGTLRIIPVVPIEKLRAQSCSAGEMIKMLEKGRVEERELENR
jgi:AbrB family looped-hinge helix DNA binding protein